MKRKLLIGLASLVVLGIIISIIVLTTNPAEFEASSLNISPEEVEPGDTVTVTVEVRNAGEEKVTHELELTIDGIVEQSRSVTLDGGETTSKSFFVEKDIEGSYSVELDGLAGIFEVAESTTNSASPDGRNVLLIDTFKQAESNILGGESTLFSTTNSWVTRELSSDEHRITADDEEGHVLKLSYDVSEEEAYAGYITSLHDLDLSDYQIITFWIKGADGGEVVLIGLRGGDDKEYKVEVGNYLQTGITATWQQVKMPLAAFSGIEDWQMMQNLSLSFENRIDSGQGTIFVDDMQFERKLGSIVIDNFDNQQGINVFGGELRVFYHGECTIDADYDSLNTADNSPSGYRISYGGSIGELLSYCGWTSGLRGTDASGIEAITFVIKGSSGGEQPNIYLYDGANRAYIDVENYTLISNSWQKVSIPLSEFSTQGVDITHLEEFQVVFEWDRMSGTIFIDNLAFSSSQD